MNKTKIDLNDNLILKSENIEYKNNILTDFLDNNTIYDSGTNSNGNWIRYKNGIMICIKKIKFTNVVIDKVWGSVYETANLVNFGNYAQEFIEIPSVSIDLADGSTCFCESFSGRTKKSIGSTWLWKPAVEADGTMTFDIIAIGKWK